MTAEQILEAIDDTYGRLVDEFSGSLPKDADWLDWNEPANMYTNLRTLFNAYKILGGMVSIAKEIVDILAEETVADATVLDEVVVYLAANPVVPFPMYHFSNVFNKALLSLGVEQFERDRAAILDTEAVKGVTIMDSVLAAVKADLEIE